MIRNNPKEVDLQNLTYEEAAQLGRVVASLCRETVDYRVVHGEYSGGRSPISRLVRSAEIKYFTEDKFAFLMSTENQALALTRRLNSAGITAFFSDVTTLEEHTDGTYSNS